MSSTRSASTKLISIQQMRGIAAAMVVWFHAMEQFPGLTGFLPASCGYLGVDIFFVISGFVMIASTRKGDARPGEFIMQRLIRVAPLYWLCTLLVAALAMALPHLFRSTQTSLAHVVQSLAFWPHWSPSHAGKIWPLLVPGWSLNYEMFFYLLFGASLLLRRELRLPALTVVFVALFAAGRVAGPFDLAPLAQVTDAVILEFIAGAWVAQIALRQERRLGLWQAWAAILFGAAMLLFHAYVDANRVAVLAGSTLTVYGSSQLQRPLIRAAWLTYLGDASYSLYLSHLFVLGLIRAVWVKIGGAPSTAGSALLFVCVCVIASSLVAIQIHHRIETPMTIRLRAAWATWLAHFRR